MSNSPRTPGVVSGRLSKEVLAENFSDLHPPYDGHEADGGRRSLLFLP